MSYLKQPIYTFYGFIGFETMSIVAGEKCNPEKCTSGYLGLYQYCLCLLYMLIIAGTIAVGSRITCRCFCTRRLC